PRSPLILDLLISKPTTGYFVAKRRANGNPTYPRPITAIFIFILDFIAVLLFIVAAVFATGHILQPFVIIQVPIDGFFQSFFKSHRWFPSEFYIDFISVDRISQVVSGPVFHKCKQRVRSTWCIAKLAVHYTAKQLDKVNVFPF